MDNNFTQIGQIGKSFGTDGFNRIKLFDSFSTFAKGVTFFFLEEEDYYVPFRVQEWARAHAMIRFDDVTDQKNADRLQAKKVFLPTSDVKHLISDGRSMLEGYTLFDGEIEIGKIDHIQELPHQLLASLNYNGRQIFIPIVEDLLVEINESSKNVVMNLPDGILEL